MEEIRHLGPRRQRKIPERFNPDRCFLLESFKEEIREVSQHYGYGYLNGYVIDLSRHMVDFRD